MSGYVYVFTNPAFPNMVKIGRTNNVDKRLKGLSASSGTPLPFECAYSVKVTNPALLEANTHAHFVEFRVNEAREFFNVSADVVRRFLETEALQPCYACVSPVGVKTILTPVTPSTVTPTSLPLGKEMNEDAVRFLINLRTPYDCWLESARVLAPGRLQWKGPDNYKSLYRMIDGNGNGSSLGPVSDTTLALYNEYIQHKEWEALRWERLTELGRHYTPFRFPRVSGRMGRIIRQLDVCGFIGPLQVVGDVAVAAYTLEAQIILPFTSPNALELGWTNVARTPLPDRDAETPFHALQRLDASFRLEKDGRAINAKSDEVEMLIAPSLVGKISPKEKFRSIPLDEQEWLLLGDPVEQLLYDTNNRPLRIVAPDPRYFALQKLWLADKPSRDPLKKDKDRTQGELVLHLVHLKMPHYPLNERFEQSLPQPLKPYFEQWKNTLSVPSKHKM